MFACFSFRSSWRSFRSYIESHNNRVLDVCSENFAEFFFRVIFILKSSGVCWFACNEDDFALRLCISMSNNAVEIVWEWKEVRKTSQKLVLQKLAPLLVILDISILSLNFHKMKKWMKIAAGTETLICSLLWTSTYLHSHFTHPKRTMMTFERLFRLNDSEKNERKNQKLFPDQRKIGEKISLFSWLLSRIFY